MEDLLSKEHCCTIHTWLTKSSTYPPPFYIHLPFLQEDLDPHLLWFFRNLNPLSPVNKGASQFEEVEYFSNWIRAECNSCPVTVLHKHLIEYQNCNPFHATALFLYPLKTSENVSVFRGYRKRPVLWNELKHFFQLNAIDVKFSK